MTSPPSALEADWLGICRRAVAGLSAILWRQDINLDVVVTPSILAAGAVFLLFFHWALVTAQDVWRRIQGRFIDRFGQPDSVRTMNALRLPKAFSGGLAAFWTKAGWCGVLTVKTIPGPDQAYVLSAIDITLEKLGTWGSENCSVFPFLVPSR